ncbi:MAG: M23 family metallopeptidase [Candidatus Daviesbacteria bacterium]|nr:M23 family metallopeptidase [Candidatus Daviesbacteria bacterium]
MDYQTKTKLILPFRGEWMVTNGGSDPSKNNHLRPDGPQNQLYGYDFRKSHRGEGRNLEDYEVFGEEVLSMGDGTIVQIIDGSIDVLPGERDRSVGVGNAIIIDHQNGEWSMLCHFKHNSIKVAVGDKIEQGAILGLCGNTGNTSEPHIHFSLQDGPLMHKSKALQASFSKILVDGELKMDYQPKRGQKVSNSV